MRLLAVAAVLAGLALLAVTASAAPGCTHGVSSVGPVWLDHGKINGHTKSDTQVCLP